MQAFAQLFEALDASTATQAKLAALKAYFASAAPGDAAWALYFLAGGKPRRTVPTALLKATAQREAGLPDWLFDECYQAVGDLAETIALVLPAAAADVTAPLGLAQWMQERLLPLRGQPPEAQAAALTLWWRDLDATGRFLLTKLIGGGFRVGVAKGLVQRALAEQAGLEVALVAQRMMGYTDAQRHPGAADFEALCAPPSAAAADAGQPYPFFLAHALDGELAGFNERLGPPTDWLVEWKYDGIRAQLVKRAGRVWVWSRGEELISERLPEVLAQAEALPDGCVLDGEVLVWRDGAPAPFQLLQQRINRKTLGKKLLAEAPVRFMAYDLLEWQGQDLRAQPQRSRRAALQEACARAGLLLSPEVQGASWADLAALRAQSRARGVEGLMLKQRSAAYGSGRTKSSGTWWKWKVDPLSVDCILIYAQAGHGRRAGLYTDYSFAVWNRAPHDAAEAQAVVQAIAQRQPAQPGALQLLPFAKAYSGLTDAEFKLVDQHIRAHTVEKFGPVRSLRPGLVFELGFEGVNRSPRHKSGVAVRFPRVLRIRHDKPLHEADSLATLQALISPTEGPLQ